METRFLSGKKETKFWRIVWLEIVAKSEERKVYQNVLLR